MKGSYFAIFLIVFLKSKSIQLVYSHKRFKSNKIKKGINLGKIIKRKSSKKCLNNNERSVKIFDLVFEDSWDSFSISLSSSSWSFSLLDFF